MSGTQPVEDKELEEALKWASVRIGGDEHVHVLARALRVALVREAGLREALEEIVLTYRNSHSPRWDKVHNIASTALAPKNSQEAAPDICHVCGFRHVFGIACPVAAPKPSSTEGAK